MLIFQLEENFKVIEYILNKLNFNFRVYITSLMKQINDDNRRRYHLTISTKQAFQKCRYTHLKIKTYYALMLDCV